MFTKIRALIPLSMLGVLLVACAHSPAPQELVDARAAIVRAQNENVERWAPNELRVAREALSDAEAAHEDEPDSQATRDLSYVAHRRAELATATAQRVRATANAQAMESERTDQLEAIARRSGEQGEEVVRLRGELGQERQARTEAEQNLRAALDSLNEIASVRDTNQGHIITLSGEVLFRTGQSGLMPTAQERLRQVAQAIQTHRGNVLVVGHTDSRGTDEMNQALSLARAQSVANFLTSNGVDPGRVRSEGRGEAEPIADNNTPEGQANNRRVEIVLENAQMP